MAVVRINKRPWPHPRPPAVALLLISVLTIIAVAGERHFDLREAVRMESPDGHHALVILQRPLVFRRSENAGAAPGILVLKRSDGQELKRIRIDHAADAADPQWRPDRIRIAGLLEWELSD